MKGLTLKQHLAELLRTDEEMRALDAFRSIKREVIAAMCPVKPGQDTTSTDGRAMRVQSVAVVMHCGGYLWEARGPILNADGKPGSRYGYRTIPLAQAEAVAPEAPAVATGGTA